MTARRAASAKRPTSARISSTGRARGGPPPGGRGGDGRAPAARARRAVVDVALGDGAVRRGEVLLHRRHDDAVPEGAAAEPPGGEEGRETAPGPLRRGRALRAAS